MGLLYPSLLCSGPGFGFSPGACASASPDDSTRPTARLTRPVLMRHLRGLDEIVAPLGAGLGVDQNLETTVDHAPVVEGHSPGVHHLRQPRILHHPGVDPVAMRRYARTFLFGTGRTNPST